jgi:uncharacterized delta-60 repeat protein
MKYQVVRSRSAFVPVCSLASLMLLGRSLFSTFDAETAYADAVTNGLTRQSLQSLPPPSPGAVDLSFNPTQGTDGQVSAIDLQQDGRIVVAGSFGSVNSVARNQLARLFPDGTLDDSFAPPIAMPGSAPHSIAAVVCQADGKVVVAGTRVSYGRMTVGEGFYVARFMASGQVDESFVPLIVPDRPWTFSTVSGMAVQQDGKVVVAIVHDSSDRFYAFSELVRVNADGSHDSSFQPPTSWTFGIYSLAIQPDQKLLVGLGDGLIRLEPDGTLDQSFQLTLDPEMTIAPWCLALQSTGAILVGGPQVIRLHPDGTLDKSFDPDHLLSGSPRAVHKDDRIVIAGIYGTSVIETSPDGYPDPTFAPPALSGSVVAVHIDDSGNLILGGAFTSINGVTRLNVARLWGGDPTRLLAPQITIQPTNQVVTVGQTVLFATSAVAKPQPVVQWLFNDTPIPGATNAVFVQTSVGLNQAGSYQAVISNSVAVLRSAVATLSVESPELRVVNPSQTSNHFNLTLPCTVTGKSYLLEFKNSLADPDWKTFSAVMGTGSVLNLSDSSGYNPSRFYRVLVE